MKRAVVAKALGLAENASNDEIGAEIDRLKARPMSSHELSGRVARLRAAAGIANEEDLKHLVAEKVGLHQFRLNGEILTGDELRAVVEKQYDEDHKLDDLYREIGLDAPMLGLDLHQRAMKLLADRGNRSPSFEEYAAALEEVAS